MGYTLVITEKPSAAEKIAHALAEGKIEKETREGVNYFRITRGGKPMVVAPAVGHLFVLSQKGSKWEYPVFDVKWDPVFSADKKNFWSVKYYKLLKSLAKDADKFISATDYDVEGSVISYNILRFMCGVKDAKRMKFSTMTKPDLEKAYKDASGHLDFGQIEAGLTRHHIDWFFGINISRALTLALKAAGGYKTLSTGRVQGPTLELLMEKQMEIEKFKSVPFWQLRLLGLLSGQEIEFFHVSDKFWKKEEADKSLKNCKGKDALVESVSEREHTQNVPFPFDLTTLQRESYQHFGYSPKQTLDIAQSLYEKAYISYPRTSSQKLPSSIGCRDIIDKLSKQRAFSELCGKLKGGKLRPNEGKKIDPAHPSIYPTGQAPRELNSYQKKLYEMIVHRFLAVFAEPGTRKIMKITLDMNGEKFSATGARTIKPGWMEFYPYIRLKEQTFPALKKGDKADVKELEMLEKETQPPGRYTQASILKEMESLRLGTKATRAHILQTLYDRGYIKEKSIHVSKLGEMVVTALRKYCPEIISPGMTKELDREMEDIGAGKLKRKDVLDKSKKSLLKILTNFKAHEKSIGEHLLTGVREVMKKESTIGPCKCGGELVIKRSRAGKRFVACTKYPKCTETFSLPHHGNLTILSDECKKCGLYIVSVKAFKKRPWKLCVRCGFVNTFKKKDAKTAGKKYDSSKSSPKAEAGKPQARPKASDKAGKAVL